MCVAPLHRDCRYRYVVRVGDATHVTVRGIGPTRSIPASRDVVKQLLRLPNAGTDTDVLVVKAPIVTGWEYDRFTVGSTDAKYPVVRADPECQRARGQSYHTEGSMMGRVEMQTRVIVQPPREPEAPPPMAHMCDTFIARDTSGHVSCPVTGESRALETVCPAWMRQPKLRRSWELGFGDARPKTQGN